MLFTLKQISDMNYNKFSIFSVNYGLSHSIMKNNKKFNL